MSFALDERLASRCVRGRRHDAHARAPDERRALALAHPGPAARGLVELIDLDAADRTQLIEEAARAARFLKAQPGADKINIGALGNIVRQLHLHVVARTFGDPDGRARSGATAPGVLYRRRRMRQALDRGGAEGRLKSE